MPQHADDGAMSRRARHALTDLVRWHDSRPRADLPSARGWLWTALIAATFFWMSNPLVFIPSFYLSLGEAMVWTKVVVVLSLPWLRVPRVPWPWVAFLGLALLSQLWTINDFHTDVSNTVYLQITALAVVVAANCTPQVVAWGLGLGGVGVVGLSIHAYREEVPGASYPVLDGDTLVNVLAGVGSNENILAYTVAVALAAMLATGRPSRLAAQAGWLLVVGVNSYGMYLAQSGTGFLAAVSIVLVTMAVALWPAARRTRRHHAAAWATGVFGITTAAILAIAVLLGKELSTVSGRAPFWRATIEATMDRSPFFGSGWGAVWEHPWDPTPSNVVVLDIYTRAGYPLSHGHNFFLDLLPELGLAGVALAVTMAVYSLREVRRNGLRRNAGDPVAGRLVLLLLVSLLVSGVTEPMLTVPLGWWSLVMAVGLTRQHARAHGSSARAGARRSVPGRRVASRPELVDPPAL